MRGSTFEGLLEFSDDDTDDYRESAVDLAWQILKDRNQHAKNGHSILLVSRGSILHQYSLNKLDCQFKVGLGLPFANTQEGLRIFGNVVLD